MNREEIFELVKEAIQDLNEDLEYATLDYVQNQTPIYGGEDSIDSLSLVRLLVNIEKSFEKKFNLPIILANEKAMSWKNSPYQSVGALVEFILTQTLDQSSHVYIKE